MTSQQIRPDWASYVDQDFSGQWLSESARQKLQRDLFGVCLHNVNDVHRFACTLKREWDVLLCPGQPTEAELATVANYVSAPAEFAFFSFGAEKDWAVQFRVDGTAFARKWLLFSFAAVVSAPTSGRFLVGNWHSDSFFVAGDRQYLKEFICGREA